MRAQTEAKGLRARIAEARRSAMFLVGHDGPASTALKTRDQQLRTIEQRLAQLEDHLTALRKWSGASIASLISRVFLVSVPSSSDHAWSATSAAWFALPSGRTGTKGRSRNVAGIDRAYMCARRGTAGVDLPADSPVETRVFRCSGCEKITTRTVRPQSENTAGRSRGQEKAPCPHEDLATGGDAGRIAGGPKRSGASRSGCIFASWNTSAPEQPRC